MKKRTKELNWWRGKLGSLIFLFLQDELVAIKRFFSIDFSEYKNIISEISSTKSELKRIGNNINQIAKHLNENKNNQTESLMSDYQNQLESLEEKIQKVVHYISEG